MIHRKAMSLMSTAEAIAATAATALSQATSQQTRPTGSTVTHNADGTKTITGSVLGSDSTGTSVTMATHVGDTTPPGIPTGVTAWSGDGSVHVAWDGTLTGGIPADFDHVTLYAKTGTDAAITLGTLTAAGSVTSSAVVTGTTYDVTATAEDDVCADDGTARHNVSAPCTAIPVTVTDVADGLSKLIRETDDGVDVGKSADGTTYADGTSVTRQGTDGSFSILKALAGVLTGVARFAEDAIDLGKNSITATIRMCADHLRIYGQSKDGSNDVYIMADVGAGERTPCSVVLGLEDFTNDAALSNGLAIQHFVPSSGDPYDRIGLMADRYLIPGAEVTDDRFATAIQPAVLFDDADSTSDTASVAASGYRDLRVFFRDTDGCRCSTDVHQEDGAWSGVKFSAMTGSGEQLADGSNHGWFKLTRFVFSDASTIAVDMSRMEVAVNGSTVSANAGYGHWIVRVEGRR